MTLCIAWKKDGKVCFASDSRASVKTSYFDSCVKVIPIPITIKLKYTTDKPTEKIEYNCGIAVAGNSLTAFSLISNISQTLRRMSIFNEHGDFSIIHVCEIVRTYFDKINKDITFTLCGKGQLAFFFCGFCLKLNKVRCFKFSPVLEDGVYEYKYEEIFTDSDSDNIQFIGSGSSKALEIFKSEKRPLYILRNLIRSGIEGSVGGPIQYGRTNDHFFNTLGIVDYEIDESKKTYYSRFYLNGFELLDDPRMLKVDTFHIDMSYANPFEDLITELNRKGFSATENPNAN
ncbi:MAG: hypothetical protein WD016_01125 [Balneolaceae bacterium]